MKELKVFEDLGYSVLVERGELSADFEIFVITGTGESDTEKGVWNKPQYEYWPEGARSAEFVDDIHEATCFAHGSVIWDGCSNWHIDEQDRAMLHECGRNGLEDIGKILAACWDLAANGYVEKWHA